jgi:hypothetical protein
VRALRRVARRAPLQDVSYYCTGRWAVPAAPRITYDALQTPTGPAASKMKTLLPAPWRRMRPEELKMLGLFASAEQLIEVFERRGRCAHWQSGNHSEHRHFCVSSMKRTRILAMRSDLLSGEAPKCALLTHRRAVHVYGKTARPACAHVCQLSAQAETHRISR